MRADTLSLTFQEQYNAEPSLLEPSLSDLPVSTLAFFPRVAVNPSASKMAMNPTFELSRARGGTPGIPNIERDLQTPMGSRAPIPPEEELSNNGSFTETEEHRRLRTRIDWKILPILSLCYFLLFSSRTNLGLIYSEKAGRYSPPNFGPVEYAIVQFVFAISYALPEPLWNVLLRLLSPRLWLALALALTGILTVFSSLVGDWKGLAALRFFVGLAAGALFPGCAYFITCWYPRRQLGRPVSIFYAGGALGVAIANIINSGLVKITTAGKLGSDWVAIIWGIVTIIGAVLVFFYTPDFPGDDERILKSDHDRELFRAWYIANDTTRNIREKYLGHAWRQAFTDLKTLLFVLVRLIIIAQNGLVGAQRGHASSLAKELFSSPSDTVNNLLYAPPLALAVITTIYLGILSDRIKERGYVLMGTSLLSIATFVVLLSTNNTKAQYIAGFAGSVGTWAAGALSWAWLANNVEGLFKRAIVIGINVGAGNLISGLTLPATGTLQTNPKIGYGYSLGICLLHLATVALTRWYLDRENAKKILARTQQTGFSESKDAMGDHMVEDMGDKNVDFDYIL